MLTISPTRTFNVASQGQEWDAMMDTPFSPLREISESAQNAFQTSTIPGQWYRGLTTPSLVGAGAIEGNRSLGERVLPDLGSELRGVIDAWGQVFSGQPAPQEISKGDWERSPYYRQGIQYDDGMTADRAAALAYQFDLQRGRQAMSDKYAINLPFNVPFIGNKLPGLPTFVGSLGGQIVDPINFVPIFGEGARAAAIARFGGGAIRDFGIHLGLEGAQNAVVTAASDLLTRDQRAQYGDDVSWEATINDVAMGAMMGMVLPAVTHGVGRVIGAGRDAVAQRMENRTISSVETPKQVAVARSVLNDAATSMATTGEVRLTEASKEQLRNLNDDVTSRTEAVTALRRETADVAGTKAGEVVITPSGARVNVQPEVVDARSLVGATGDLQVRDRTRDASQTQIEDMAINLDPARLQPSVEADRGAPIVGQDNVIDSGNGRVAAIQRAYEAYPDRANAYRQSLEDAGYSTEGIEQPVLIQRRTTDLSPQARAQFNGESNNSATARMSATEIANMDRSALDDGTLETLADGPITSADNRAFVRRFLANLPGTERSALESSTGTLNSDGVRRVENALVAAAYTGGDPSAIGRFAEATDGNTRSVVGAMSDVAGKWALMRRAIGRGDIDPKYDITTELTTALRNLSQWREQAAKEGRPVSIVIKEGMGQLDMLSDDAEAKAMVRLFYKTDDFKQSAGREAIASRLSHIVDEAYALGTPQLFDDAVAATRLGIISATNPNRVRRPSVIDQSTAEFKALGFAAQQIERDYALATKMGLVDDIEDSSVRRLTAKQAVNELGSRLSFFDDAAKANGEEHFAQGQKETMVRAVRSKLGIPSMDDRAEFDAWLNEVKNAASRFDDAGPEAFSSPDAGTGSFGLGEKRGERATADDRQVDQEGAGSGEGRGSIADQMSERFRAAGRPDDEAKAVGALVENFYRQQASALGVNVSDVVDRFGLPEVRQGTGAATLPDGMLGQDGIKTGTISPEKLVFREGMQNRLEEVRDAFPEGEGYTPIVVIGRNGEKEILDGHNRSSVARERGDEIPYVEISDADYQRLQKAGYDDMEVSYAALSEAGEDEAASLLNRQFPGAKVAERGMEAQGLLDDEFDPNEQTLFQPAYHGTPHLFDRFSSDKIGTGEGAQAYGYGLYFSSDKDVAAWYRDQLTEDQSGPAKVSLAKANGNVDAAIANETAEIERLRKLDLTPETGSMRRDNMVADRENRVRVLTMYKETGRWVGGRLFTVDVPHDNELLNWDAPLSEQPAKVKAALKSLGFSDTPASDKQIADPAIRAIVKKALAEADGDPDQIALVIDNDGDLYKRAMQHAKAAGKSEDDLEDGPGEYVVQQAKTYLDAVRSKTANTGEAIYKKLSEANGGDAAASAKLREAGIPGQRYIGHESDKTNYVIYDDSRVNITDFEQAKRGAISLPSDSGNAMITLFESADASTALHEAGHFFLSVFKQMADRDDAPLPMKADLQTVKNWWASNAEAVASDSPHDGVTGDDVLAVLQNGTSGDRVKDLAIDVGLHEQWARGFESYLREGQAPTSALQRIFDQFRNWLTSIYRSAQDLRVNISPEMRQVFGRLISSDESTSRISAEPRMDFSDPRPEPPPAGLAEAAKRVQQPETMRMLAEQHGVSEDGSFPEMDAINLLRDQGRLSEEDVAQLDAADQVAKNADAWNKALMTAVTCAFGNI